MHVGVWWGNLKVRAHLKELRIDGRIMDLKEMGWVGTDCIHLAKIWDKCQDLVNMAMNLRGQ
jgi:hypothetical protein